MKNVGDAGFSRKRGGNTGSGPPFPDPVNKLNSLSTVLLLPQFVIRQDHGFGSPHEPHQLPGWLCA